jgi:hypothetical protein
MTQDPHISETLIVKTLSGILSVQRQLQEDQIRSQEDHHGFLQNLALFQQQLEQVLMVQRNLQLDQLRQQDQTSRLLDQIDRVMYNQMKQQELLDKIIDFNISYIHRIADSRDLTRD